MGAFNIILFDGFEILDAFGPAEIIARLPETYTLGYYSRHGGSVTSSQHASVNTLSFADMDAGGVLLIPGGLGTRKLIADAEYLGELRRLAEQAAYVLTVCTGSALLACTGLLNGRRATSNKLVFEWASSNGEGVSWQKRARWVVDDKYYTSSGVSAGMDMTLGFIQDLHGGQVVQEICKYVEYTWHSDKDNDPFAVV